MLTGQYSARGFEVAASSAIELVTGTQAAGSGMVSANLQDLAQSMHVDLGAVSSQIANQTRQLSSVNEAGFSRLGQTVSRGLGGLSLISGVSLAVQAAGFVAVAQRLSAVRGDIQALHSDIAEQGQQLISLQAQSNARLESLVTYAERTLKTQEKILETLVSSRTVEAQQFIRQGWENLIHGYEDDAFTRFQRSLEFDNTVYVAHAELGRLYEKRGELDRAEDHFRRATRFARSAGDRIQGFAHIQFAGFLDRRGRYSEAADSVEAALSIPGQEQQQLSSWRIYLAELKSVSGQYDAAIDVVMQSVAECSANYVAALSSERLTSTQPKLTSRLLVLDERRRSEALKSLEGSRLGLVQLESLSYSQSVSLRATGQELLRRLLSAPFADLEQLVLTCGEFERTVNSAAASAASEFMRPLQDSAERLRKLAAAIPPPVQRVEYKRPSAWAVGILGVWLHDRKVKPLMEAQQKAAAVEDAAWARLEFEYDPLARDLKDGIEKARSVIDSGTFLPGVRERLVRELAAVVVPARPRRHHA